jgi:predicted RNase H-like nuclease
MPVTPALLQILPYPYFDIKSAMSKFLRKDLSKDDILDALVLAVTASYPSEKLVTFPPNPHHDEKQLRM